MRTATWAVRTGCSLKGPAPAGVHKTKVLYRDSTDSGILPEVYAFFLLLCRLFPDTMRAFPW